MLLPNSDYSYVPSCSISNWSTLSNSLGENKFSVMSMNIRSITGKFSEFVSHLNLVGNRFTFIVVTETWLSESTDFGFDIEGYRCISVYRENRRGGGIKIYYLDTIKASIMNSISGCTGPCERLFLQTNVPGIGSLVLGAVYRPPDQNIGDFCELMDSTLNSLGGSRSVIVGDFNLNTLNYSSDPHVQRYVDVFSQYGLVNEINEPTYRSPVTNSDSSCLDHIWHNLKQSRRSYIVNPNLSDHYPTCLIYDKAVDAKQLKIRFRNFSESNVGMFEANISSEFEQFST